MEGFGSKRWELSSPWLGPDDEVVFSEGESSKLKASGSCLGDGPPLSKWLVKGVISHL